VVERVTCGHVGSSSGGCCQGAVRSPHAVVAGVHIDRDSVGLGHLNNVLDFHMLVDDLFDLLNDFTGNMDMLDDLDLVGNIHDLGNVHILLNNLGLGDMVGPVDINRLELRNVAHLLNLHDLGNVLDDLHRSVNVVRDVDVPDLLNDLSFNLGDMLDHLEGAFLGDDLRHMADDLLDVHDLLVAHGDGDVDGDRSLDMADLGNGNLNFADLRDRLHNGHLDVLLHNLGHVDGAVNNDLPRHVLDLSNLDLNGARNLTVLNDLNRDVLVDNLMLGHLHDPLHRDGARDRHRDLDVLHDVLQLDLGNLHNPFNGPVDVLHLGDLNDALPGLHFGDMDDALCHHVTLKKHGLTSREHS